MTTATRRRNSVSAPAPQRITNDDIRDAQRDLAQRVLARLEKAPRFQSIGRNKYVFLGDVEQVMQEELYRDGGEE